MGCVFAKKSQETIFYQSPPSNFQKNKEQLKVEATLHANKNSAVMYVMSLKNMEFQPEFKIKKNAQNGQDMQATSDSNRPTSLNTSQVSPMRKLQIQKMESNYKNQDGIKEDNEGKLFVTGLRLIKNEQSLIISCNNDSQLQNLRMYLNSRIVQRGFQNQYKIVKKLGQGGFAAVYLVIKRENNEKFAVKIFSKESIKQEKDGVEALENEISIMRSLKHINILRVHEVFTSTSSIYMIMDVHTGGTLEEKIKNKETITAQNVRQITRQILYGLEHMHSKRIMHRDLKPENIIFKNKDITNYQCVIADFGLATRIDISKYLYTKCGTPGFVAPEVWEYTEQMKYNEQCDIYSIGIIFHILVLGYSPFDDSDLNVCIRKNRKGIIQWDHPDYDRLKPQTVDLLKQMLAINPAKRITPSKAINHKYFESRHGTVYYQEKVKELKLNFKDQMNEDYLDSPQKLHSGFQTPKLKKQNIKKNIKQVESDFQGPQTPLMKGRDYGQNGQFNFENAIASPMPSNQKSPDYQYSPNDNTPRQRRQSKFAQANQFVFPSQDDEEQNNKSEQQNSPINSPSSQFSKKKQRSREYSGQNEANTTQYDSIQENDRLKISRQDSNAKKNPRVLESDQIQIIGNNKN